MVELGYWLSSEEHPPADLVRYARRAEEMGFPFALISDHYHPWIDRQGHSPFVWGVIGGIGQAAQRGLPPNPADIPPERDLPGKSVHVGGPRVRKKSRDVRPRGGYVERTQATNPA